MAKSPWRRATSSTANPQRPVQIGKPMPARISSSSSAVDHVPVKNSAAGIDAPAARRHGLELGVEREGDRGQLGRRVGVGERAADRAAVADLEVPDQRERPRQQRDRRRRPSASRSTVAWVVDAPIHTVVRRGCSMPRSSSTRREVDDVLEHGEAHRQQRDEALPAGEHLGVVEVGEQWTTSSIVSGAW